MGDIEKTTDDCETALSVSSVKTEIQRQAPSRRVILWAGAVISLLVTALTVALYPTAVIYTHEDADAFYRNITTITDELCPGINGSGVSHAGHIGLHGDTESRPKRSFFWYFEAEQNPTDAPVILTMGGGPGTTGFMNLLYGQGPCIVTSEGLVPHANRWTEHYNLVVLDHPIGVGYSYGTRVNNSLSAAHDVYDFLQKFFFLYPHLVKNKFVVAGGSYGGIYLPNIATVIHQKNKAIANGEFKHHHSPVHINLDSLMVSNPLSNPASHFGWLLQYMCYNTNVYNSTTCHELYTKLPSCLELIELAFQNSNVQTRTAASHACWQLALGDMHGTVTEDIRRKCESDDVRVCHPQFAYMEKYIGSPDTKAALGMPSFLNFTALNMDVNTEFAANGDIFKPHHLLYEPLLTDGIRVLHYIGAQDANCPWPGTLSFLKLLRTPFQDEFLTAKDAPWPTSDIATVRTVGKGAGNMTFVLIHEAGHFTVHDQPALVKKIIEHWIENRPFFS